MTAVLETKGGTSPAGGLFDASSIASDTVELPYPTRAIYVGGAGDVTVISAKGETVTFTGVTAGSILPIQISHLKSTGTTATLIIGMY